MTRTPAQVIKLVIDSGNYNPDISYMCSLLSSMLCYDEITPSEYSYTKQSINDFLVGWGTLRGMLTAKYSIQISSVPSVALAIYSDWDNRDAILAQAVKDYAIDYFTSDDWVF